MKTKTQKTRASLSDPTIAETRSHGGQRDGSGRRKTGRRSITIYLREEIIKEAGRRPAARLRQWIEANWQKKLENNT